MVFFCEKNHPYTKFLTDSTLEENTVKRRTFYRNLLLAAVAAPSVPVLGEPLIAQAASQTDQSATPPAPCHRSLTEYKLPPAMETHEIIKMPDSPLILISQQSNSHLVKLWLDPMTEQTIGVKAFLLGSTDSMLHGLRVSRWYPGKIWATLEASNKLLLVDPGSSGLAIPPKIIRTIDIPDGGKGPHYVEEYGEFLWVTLKESYHVLAINHTDPTSYSLYQALPHPIFVARHPISDEFYVSEDVSSKLLRINFATQTTSQIAIPPAHGQQPVGLVAGPTGIWFVLLGTAQQGTGTFGRINAQGEITWFRLTLPEGRNAGLLHIAFDPPGTQGEPHAWLLGSSIISPNVFDMIVRVTFDPAYTQLKSEEIAVLPTQLCKAHRLLPLPHSVLATELSTSTVAQLRTMSDCRWMPSSIIDPGPG
jgi:virginiamycin B lyase